MNKRIIFIIAALFFLVGSLFKIFGGSNDPKRVDSELASLIEQYNCTSDGDGNVFVTDPTGLTLEVHFSPNGVPSSAIVYRSGERGIGVNDVLAVLNSATFKVLLAKIKTCLIQPEQIGALGDKI